METATAKKTFKRKAKPKPKAKITTKKKDEYDLFIKEAKDMGSEFIICGSEEDTLIEVNDWIMMPKEIQNLIGVKGVPCGLITMVYGPPDCGKTTFCNEALASTQRDGGFAVLFLSELKYSNRRAEEMGIKSQAILSN